LQQYEFGEAVA